MWSRMNFGEQRLFGVMLVKWVVLGSAVGVLSGTASAVFLVALNWATAVRVANPALLFLLPLAGLVIGWGYYRMGGSAMRGCGWILSKKLEPVR